MRDLAILNNLEEENVALNFEPNTPSEYQGCSADILQIIEEKMQSEQAFFSVEFIPAGSQVLQDLLDESLQAMMDWPPLFASVTWQPNALQIQRDTSSGKIIEVNHPALVLCRTLQSKYNTPALLHLSAALYSTADVIAVLNKAQAMGIRNILALRGDLKNESANADFHHGIDLVRFIRREYGTFFTIGVAGYPAGHPEASSYPADLQRLKEKVDAGADFILTQMVFEPKILKKFAEDCRRIGISKPILPGLLLIQKVAAICNVNLPKQLCTELDLLSGNEKAEEEFCKGQIETIIKELLNEGCWPGFHLFTLNRLIPSLEVCQRLGLQGNSSKDYRDVLTR